MVRILNLSVIIIVIAMLAGIMAQFVEDANKNYDVDIGNSKFKSLQKLDNLTTKYNEVGGNITGSDAEINQDVDLASSLLGITFSSAKRFLTLPGIFLSLISDLSTIMTQVIPVPAIIFEGLFMLVTVATVIAVLAALLRWAL